jgi:DNA anti-recombination protein RmuC
MRSLFGFGGNKLKEEVNKIDKDIEELLKRLRGPADSTLDESNIKNAKNLIKKISENIEQYKELLESRYRKLGDFQEINKLKESINNLLKILEYTYEKFYKTKKITQNEMMEYIRMGVRDVEYFWKKHRYELSELGIIKK